MKLALYTIFRCTNYGAVLQALALARTLRALPGVASVDVLNHRMDPRDNHLLGKITNPETPWFQRWRNRRKFAKRYLQSDRFEVRRAKTVRLIDEAVRPTARLYRSPDELRGLPPYDVVVVGSDQIWNPLLNTDFGRNQYLATDLPEGQARVAYAASFGISELPPEFRGAYRAAIAKFRAVTCREESGARICEALLGTRPEVVLDPTLLLDAAVWTDLAADRLQAVPRGALAAYWVRTPTQADVDALAACARRAGAPLRLMSAGPLPRLDLPPEVVPVVDADPLDFVAEIAGASAVVTDSFHGLQFATVFRKPFVALGALDDPRANASRLVDFGARYGLGAGIGDIARFRAGEPAAYADFAAFDAARLDADRARSRELLKGMVAP